MLIAREKLMALNEVFTKLASEKANVFFHYILNKNKNLISEELKVLEAVKVNPNERVIEYEKKRIKICEDFCVKDENGEPAVLDKGLPTARYDFSKEDMIKVNDMIDILKVEHSQDLEELDNNRKQFLELLSEEIEIPLSKFKLKHLPQELVGKDVELLFDLIEED
jgi:hypothetical protein